MKLNNKGQTLVLFVLLLPIMLMILLLVIDVGNIVLCKQELNDINYIVMEYGIDNNNTENIEKLLVKNNVKENEYNIKIEDNCLYIEINKQVNSFIGLTKYKVISSYKGNLENKEIERVR